MSEFEQTGRVWFRNALSEAELRPLDTECDLDAKAGARVAVTPAVETTLNKISAMIGAGMRPVRMVAFNKTSAQNWGCRGIRTG